MSRGASGFFLVVMLSVTPSATSLAAEPIPDIETFMQIGAASGPALTRDGSTLFFTTTQTGTRQLYRLTPEGWPYQLTFFPSGIGAYTLSRDGRSIGLTAAPAGTELFQIYLCDAATGSLQPVTKEPGSRFGAPVFSPDDRRIYFSANAGSASDFHVYGQDLASGDRTVLYQREGVNGVFDLSDDGRWLLIGHANTNYDNDLYAVDTRTGEAIHLTPHEGEVLFGAAVFGADPHTVHLIADDNAEGIARIGRIVWDEGRAARVSDRPAYGRSAWPCESLAISPDRRVLAWIVNEEGYGRIHLRDLGRDREIPTPDLEGVFSSLTLSAAGSMSFAYTSPVETADVWTWEWRRRRLVRRTFSSYAGIDPAWFTRPELTRYKSFDGQMVPAFVYLPREWKEGNPIPFIVDVHGGPEGQSRPLFNRHFQYLLLHGYGIFVPNVRGSTGYGRAWCEADDYRRRLDSVKDLAWGARHLIARGLTTADRIGVKGASYGGYMTLAAMTEFPDLFAAGIDEVGIANFETFLAGTAAYRRSLRASEYGPAEDVEFLRSISPIHKIDRIRGALMVVHGVNDPRVPIGEARQIIRSLRDGGAEVDSLIFPDEGHSVGKLSNRLVLYRKMVEFFDRHLKRKEVPPGP